MVVPPGVVDAIIRQITLIARYQREVGLYIADFTVSEFAGQDPKA